MISDELIHVIKQLAAQAVVEQRPWVYGHISSYNPNNHSARVIIPSMRDDQSGEPLHSGWLPMLTTQASSQVGLQIIPHGGATSENPSAGEQVMVAINERGTGVAAIIGMFWTQQQQPPNNAALPSDTKLNPGEALLRHESGTKIHQQENGDLRIESPVGNIKAIAGHGTADPSGLGIQMEGQVISIICFKTNDTGEGTGGSSGQINTGTFEMTPEGGTRHTDANFIQLTSPLVALTSITGIIQITSKNVLLTLIPRSPAGLEAGGLWRDSNNFVKIV